MQLSVDMQIATGRFGLMKGIVHYFTIIQDRARNFMTDFGDIVILNSSFRIVKSYTINNPARATGRLSLVVCSRGQMRNSPNLRMSGP